MDDLISRQAAIDVLMKLIEARLEWKSDASREINGLNAAYCAIEDLPSVPQNLQPTCNQFATDCISRKAAIDELKKTVAVNKNPNHDARIWEEGMNCAITIIGALPSAEPTLYGYKIEHLAYIARVMEKEGITAEDAARTFSDLGLAVSMIRDEIWQKMEEAIHDHNTGSI